MTGQNFPLYDLPFRDSLLQINLRLTASLIHKLCSSHDLNPGRRNEVKLLIWYLDVFLLLMKAKFGLRAVEFLNHDADDEAVRRYFNQRLLYAIAHAFRNSPEDKVARI